MLDLKKLDITPTKILKLFGIAIASIVLIAIAASLLGFIFNSLRSGFGSGSSYGLSKGGYAPLADGVAFDSYGAPALSVRNAVQSSKAIPNANYSTGDEAEDFEVLEYSASIETRELENTCEAVALLKKKDYVIFETANKYDKGCNHRFKVKRDNVSEVLDVIKNLDPKELSENIYTIKKTIDDFTSEAEILEEKRESIDSTLNSAISAYDEISAIAKESNDAASLAQIIDGKVSIIEKLTQERININAQLERLARSKAEQLDRLAYTFFSVSIFENKFIDGDNIASSWKESVKRFVRNVNKVAQDITVNLAGFILLVIQYVIYLFILLIAAKYGWRLVKYIWKK